VGDRPDVQMTLNPEVVMNSEDEHQSKLEGGNSKQFKVGELGQSEAIK